MNSCEHLQYVEKLIFDHIVKIESWFREKFLAIRPSITSSVDLRNAGFKLAPVDVNLFPAGFNNLNSEFIPLCVQAIQSFILEYVPKCCKILLIPEAHTRNKYYLQSLSILHQIFKQAGFLVRIGSLDSKLTMPQTIEIDAKQHLLLEPLIRDKKLIKLQDFEPCLIILNNDLSSGIPDILQDISQPIYPPATLGWYNRLKTNFFTIYNFIADEFASLINLDPWLINPYFLAVDNIDFMAKEGLENLVEKTSQLLSKIANKYLDYGIKQKPFVAIKADNGTYGRSVMMVQDSKQLMQLNRKQRTNMAIGKGGEKVTRVIIQEGIYTFESTPEGDVAEPVLYMIGQFVVGGFYRVHQGRDVNDNLNAPGMHFAPLAFSKACNTPYNHVAGMQCPNRFYIYGIISRLAALAAAKEIETSS